MISKSLLVLCLAIAAAPLSAAAVTLDCAKVAESAALRTVVNDGALIYAADKYMASADVVDTKKSKELYKTLKKRLVTYWLKNSGYESITIESSGMASQVTECDGEKYAVLYVPVDSVKIYEKKKENQEAAVANDSPQRLEFESMQ